MFRQRGEKIDRGCGSGDAFVVLCSGFEAVGRGPYFWKVDGIEKLFAAAKDTDVRSIEFISRAGEKIAADLFDVDQFVGGEMHGIDKTQRSGIAGHLHDLFKIVDRPKDVRSRADRHELGLFIEQIGEFIQFKLPGLDIHRQYANR